jgi:two-component system sensor histidine kinase BaeS
MSVLAAGSWLDAIADKPGQAVVALVALTTLAIAGGLALKALTRHTRMLRHLVVAINVASLVMGAVAAVLLARLMVLDDDEARTVIGVLAVAAVFATVLAIVASGSLGSDARRVEAALRQLEVGDHTARTQVVRADELGHVASALDELAQRLDVLERERASVEAERSLMLSSVGHDLRTPLAALRAAIEALQDGVATDQPRYLKAMARDVDALTILVDDLFLLSRIEAGRLELSCDRVDLAELADDAVESITPAAAARDVVVRLCHEHPVTVQADAQALGRVMRNLLDNAVQHAPAHSTIDVAVGGDPTPTVRVVDQGPGFDSAFMAEAFDRFTRAEASRSRASGGAGLGLAIARGLVEAQGGRIWIEPPPGGHVAFALPPWGAHANGNDPAAPQDMRDARLVAGERGTPGDSR